MIATFEQWKKDYDIYYRRRLFTVETANFIKKGFCDLSPEDVDKMIDTLEYRHKEEFMRLA